MILNSYPKLYANLPQREHRIAFGSWGESHEVTPRGSAMLDYRNGELSFTGLLKKMVNPDPQIKKPSRPNDIHVTKATERTPLLDRTG